MRSSAPFALLAFCLSCGAVKTAPHPLTPLSAQEITAAARLVKNSGRVPASAQFCEISLDEPPKESVLRNIPAPRRAFAVLYDYPSNKTWEAIANLDAARLDSFREIPGAQPALTAQDSDMAQELLFADPRFRQALEARGIHDLNHVTVMAWSAGFFGLPGSDAGRIVRAVPYFTGAGENYFAHPIEGLAAHVNLTGRKILDLVDIDRAAPVSRQNFDLSAAANRPWRPAPAPLYITQPAGPGFAIVDGEIRWQKWRFRYALHPREGVVLYQVGYEDGGKVRPVMYRGSLSEMVVPYGDPSAAWFFRNSFDVGELGLGRTASPLRPGVDCPENCSVFDAVVADESGDPETIPGAVAIYERDGGISWKHDQNTRRARDLVVSYLTQPGNYEYGFDWIFHQDGTLEMRVALTGIMAVKGIADGAHDPYGHTVAKNLEAPHHQHFFTFRLDLDVDGPANRVIEMNSEAVPNGPQNPYGGAFTMRETPLLTEKQAQRNLDLAASRKWIVTNPGALNALGQPTGFALLPGENALPYAQPDSWVRKRAGFLNAHVWVTPYSDSERYAGGDYPNQSRGGDGLAQWTAGDRSIDNRDVVLWYTMGMTHNPRPEDWPVMPVQTLGFKLAPWGFFAQNPAMDLPPAR
jgi:primary-amine oxidase